VTKMAFIPEKKTRLRCAEKGS